MSIWEQMDNVLADGEVRKDKAKFIAHYGVQIAASMVAGFGTLGTLSDTECQAIAERATKLAACVYDCAVKAAAAQ